MIEPPIWWNAFALTIFLIAGILLLIGWGVNMNKEEIVKSITLLLEKGLCVGSVDEDGDMGLFLMSEDLKSYQDIGGEFVYREQVNAADAAEAIYEHVFENE